MIKFPDDITGCLKKKDQVTKDLKSVFENVKIVDTNLRSEIQRVIYKAIIQ